jgi:hypothetical protein
MARPLRLDDQFVMIIQEKIQSKFLNLYTMKVQSTAFYQRVNLQKALMLVATYDIILGLIILFKFFTLININENNPIYILENLIFVSGIVFGLIGFDVANNLKKKNSKIYKNWRIFVTFAVFIIEVLNSMGDFCYYTNCSFMYFIIVSAVYLIVNLYFIKIAWSFHIRLDRNHELLIVHGKYLEKMIQSDNYKIKNERKYIPPHVLSKNKKEEKELISLPNNINIIEDNIFAPKTKPNPFLSHLKTSTETN